MQFERYIWVSACVRYFCVEADSPFSFSELLDTLGTNVEEFAAARRHYEEPVIASAATGDVEPAKALTAQIEHAKVAVGLSMAVPETARQVLDLVIGLKAGGS